MALRQARAASARGTSKAPTAFRRSPPHSPTTRAGRPRPQRGRAPMRVARASPSRRMRDVDSAKHASAGVHPSTARSTLNPARPANAISASATARPPSLTSWMPETSRSTTSRAARSCSARAASRSAAGGSPPVSPWTAAHSDPPSSATRRAEDDDALARRQSRAGGASVSMSTRPITPTTGVGWMSAPRDSL